MPFKGVDFYKIDDLLTDEERMVRDTVRRFVDERVIPIIDKHFEEATFPTELIQPSLIKSNWVDFPGSSHASRLL